MFFELTELLACPCCGPDQGLVLLVEEVRDRRVTAGWLGCPNCRRDFPVKGGIADLRCDPASETAAADPFDEEELEVKVAALSGLTEGPAYLLVDERLAPVAGGVADLLPGVEVIAVGRSVEQMAERPGVSRLLSDVRFPVVDGRLRAVALTIDADCERVEAGARALAPGGRLVMFEAGDAALERVEEWGLEILARDSSAAVARKRDPFADAE